MKSYDLKSINDQEIVITKENDVVMIPVHSILYTRLTSKQYVIVLKHGKKYGEGLAFQVTRESYDEYYKDK